MRIINTTSCLLLAVTVCGCSTSEPETKDTPLGEIAEVKVATGEEMVGSWEQEPEAGRAFVLVELHAKKDYPLSDITTWAVVDSEGNRHGIVAVMNDFGTLTGVGSIAAPGGTPDKPQKNTFVFEVPKSATSQLDLFVGDERVGVLTK